MPLADPWLAPGSGLAYIQSGSPPRMIPSSTVCAAVQFNTVYAGDRDEPPHVHVEREDKVAKFWLDPVRLQSSGGFPRAEIPSLHKLVVEHQLQLVEAWNDYFHD